jgi:hypothetical protein
MQVLGLSGSLHAVLDAIAAGHRSIDASFGLTFFRQSPDLVSVTPHLPMLEEKIEKTSPTG